ncbi:EP300-interacting inhibitor of differentiation 3 [Hetaerina americana]|uniref:EP300-interacting inhibitor of differentiation 3 n=1 Tax=Hetaerina americana TaxID=62018 RepID=UPI003A7F60D6
MSSDKEKSLMRDYQILLLRVEEIRKQDVGLDAVRKLIDAMDDAEKLVESVSTPREIGFDARVLELTSVVVQQNTEKLDSVFRPLNFADKLVTMLASQRLETSQSEANIWTQFAENFGYLLPLRPSFDYINGTYDREGFKPKERAQRHFQRKKENMKEVLNTRSDDGQDDQVLGQQEILDKISKKLKNLYKTTGNNPINYFEFILNPDSFEETCQNILNVAFLVRDTFVKMFMKNDELVLAPCKPNNSGKNVLQKEESKRQFVIQIDRRDWKNLVEAHNVTKPMINFGLVSRNICTTSQNN